MGNTHDASYRDNMYPRKQRHLRSAYTNIIKRFVFLHISADTAVAHAILLILMTSH